MPNKRAARVKKPRIYHFDGNFIGHAYTKEEAIEMYTRLYKVIYKVDKYRFYDSAGDICNKFYEDSSYIMCIKYQTVGMHVVYNIKNEDGSYSMDGYTTSLIALIDKSDVCVEYAESIWNNIDTIAELESKNIKQYTIEVAFEDRACDNKTCHVNDNSQVNDFIKWVIEQQLIILEGEIVVFNVSNY